MTEDELAASVPVCVEIVPTVMDLELTPGALPADVAPTGTAGTRATLKISADAVSTVPSTVRPPQLARMPYPRSLADGTRGVELLKNQSPTCSYHLARLRAGRGPWV